LNHRHTSYLRLTLIALGFAGLTALVGAQQPAGGPAPQAPAAPTGPLAPEKYKNIEVLKDIPADQLDTTMRFISASTGMRCTECHVQEADGQFSFDKDDKKPKQDAREMIKLERGINQQFFNNRVQVTCNTCHRGSNRPVAVPGLAEMFTAEQLAAMNAPARQGGPPQGAPPAGGAPGQAPGGRGGPPLPAVDDVIAKYVTAIGGQAAVEKLQSLVLSGTLTNRSGQNLAFTIEQKSPTKYRETVQSQPNATTRAFDGAAGWRQDGQQPAATLAGLTLQQATRIADLGLATSLKTRYEGLRAVRGLPINGTATLGLSGTTAPNVTDTLYFDASTGLLLRRTISTRTPLGNLPEQIDYSDYRDVAGVKLPFTIKRASWEFVDTLKVVDVKPNAQVADGRFTKP
jgi:photosynthetic reaction center cytochrome c subunit